MGEPERCAESVTLVARLCGYDLPCPVHGDADGVLALLAGEETTDGTT